MASSERDLTWRRIAALQAEELALLHAAELDRDTLDKLVQVKYPDAPLLATLTEDGQEAVVQFQRVVAELDGADALILDDLAADYAAIYLTGALHASPNESVWLDEDHLERQQPMFAVRAFYKRWGFAVSNWRARPDDNLSLQLSFIAALLRRFDDAAALAATAQFLDEHLLRWLGSFSNRVASRCATPFYAALSVYTFAAMDELRTILERVLGEPRKRVETAAQPAKAPPSPADSAPYFPGTAPSW